LLRHAPENTLPAFAACVDLQIGIELDIRTTQDGHLVVLHDPSVMRTTDGGDRAIADLTLEQAKKLDAGSWFDPTFAGLEIPTLEETFELIRKRKRGSTIVALNVKHLTLDGEKQLVSLVEKYELIDQSFAFDQSDEMSRRLKDLNAEFRIGQNVSREEIQSRIDEKLLDVFLLRSVPTRTEVSLLRRHHKQILFNFAGAAESRRNPDVWNAARDAGIDGILTDFPLECRAVWRAAEKPVSQIAFGSCIKQEQPIPILATVLKQQPDLFVFLGDNIYADTNDMDVMRAKYAKLKSDAGFSLLIKSQPVMATWDDHDYGINDGGAEYAMRKESQRVFVDFWNDPADSPRRQRAGVYQSQMFGPEGKRVQMIVLDTRYFRGPLKMGERRVGGPYVPSDDASATMLGDEQWQWLEEQLKMPAEVRIIASSIQCVSESSGHETWSNFPHERKRFFDLIARTKASGVVIISGDRHWSELSVEREAAPYPIFDLTSSSLNQIHARGTPTANRYRDIETTYHQPNFGTIRINWERDDPQLLLQIADMEGKAVFEKTVRLSQLQFPD
jgi:alkaline phosphatase D